MSNATWTYLNQIFLITKVPFNFFVQVVQSFFDLSARIYGYYFSKFLKFKQRCVTNEWQTFSEAFFTNTFQEYLLAEIKLVTNFWFFYSWR